MEDGYIGACRGVQGGDILYMEAFWDPKIDVLGRVLDIDWYFEDIKRCEICY